MSFPLLITFWDGQSVLKIIQAFSLNLSYTFVELTFLCKENVKHGDLHKTLQSAQNRVEKTAWDNI